MPVITLLDIAKANGADAVAGIIDEVQKATPEISMGAARTIKGISYKTLVRVGAPGNTGGSFRAANAGSLPTKSIYENRTFETYIAEPRIECDKAVAVSSEDGAIMLLEREAKAVLKAELIGLAKQFYYGVANNSQGFPGLLAAYDATNMVVDAGGTTASTGSSVWAVKFGPEDVQWIYGNVSDGNPTAGNISMGANSPIAFTPVRTETLIDAADSSRKYDGYVQTALYRPGLQVASLNSVGRIKKLTADSGKGLTDALINQLLAKFPTGTQPDVFFMTRRSLLQLQSSRTATTPTGQPAPFPTNIVGIGGVNISIYVTDSIIDTEALTL